MKIVRQFHLVGIRTALRAAIGPEPTPDFWRAPLAGFQIQTSAKKTRAGRPKAALLMLL